MSRLPPFYRWCFCLPNLRIDETAKLVVLHLRVATASLRHTSFLAFLVENQSRHCRGRWRSADPVVDVTHTTPCSLLLIRMCVSLDAFPCL
jgi:hypothetical protein